MELPDEFLDDLDLRPHGYQIESLLDGYELSNYHLLYYVSNINSGIISVAKVTDIYGIPEEAIHSIYNESNLLSYLYNCWSYNTHKSNNIDPNNKWNGIPTMISDASTCTTPSNSQELLDTPIDFYSNNTTFDLSIAEMTSLKSEPSIFPIVKLETTITLPSHIIMIIENCQGGTLHSLIKRYADSNNKIPFDYVKSITSQLLNAMDFIHSKMVYHGDLNPTNILFSDKQQSLIKISDFETSQWQNDDKIQKSSILVENTSDLYKPPEHLLGSYNPTASADLWSLGAIIFEMITLTLYSNSNYGDSEAVYYEYKSQRMGIIPSEYSPIVPLLDTLLDFYPTKRLEAYAYKF